VENLVSLLADAKCFWNMISSFFRDITERKYDKVELHEAFPEMEEMKNRFQVENIYLQEEFKVEQDFGKGSRFFEQIADRSVYPYGRFYREHGKAIAAKEKGRQSLPDGRLCRFLNYHDKVFISNPNSAIIIP
jgi:hypothetical protein